MASLSIDPGLVLALVTDLFVQVAALREQNQRLQARVEELEAPPLDGMGEPLMMVTKKGGS